MDVFSFKPSAMALAFLLETQSPKRLSEEITLFFLIALKSLRAWASVPNLIFSPWMEGSLSLSFLRTFSSMSASVTADEDMIEEENSRVEGKTKSPQEKKIKNTPI